MAELSTIRPLNEIRAGLTTPVIVGAAVLVVVADVHLPDLGWQGQSLSFSRVLALGLTWVAASLVGLIALTQLNRAQARALAPLAALLGWAGLASLAGFAPTRSLFVWLGLVAVALAALALVRRGIEASLWALVIASGMITYASLGAQVLGLAQSEGRLFGVTVIFNMLGQIGGLFVLSGLLLAARGNARVPVAVAVLPAGLAAIYLSDTRTAALGVVFALLVLVVRTRTLISLATLGAAFALVVIFVNPSDVADTARRSESESLSNFTGRPRLWEFSIDETLERPVLGAGLATAPLQFGRGSAGLGTVIEQASSHNLALEIARETGIVGLGLAILAVLWARPWRVDPLAPIFFYLLLTGTTMPMSGFPGVIMLAWFVVIATGVLRRRLTGVASPSASASLATRHITDDFHEQHQPAE